MAFSSSLRQRHAHINRYKDFNIFSYICLNAYIDTLRATPSENVRHIVITCRPLPANRKWKAGMSSLAKHVAVTRGIFFFSACNIQNGWCSDVLSFFFYLFFVYVCSMCKWLCVLCDIIPFSFLPFFFLFLYSCYGCLVFGNRCFLLNVSVERIFCSMCHVSPTVLCQTMRRILQKTRIFHMQCISDFGEHSLWAGASYEQWLTPLVSF